MIPYIVTFILSLLFIGFSLSEKKHGKTKFSLILLIIGLLFPCLLAAFRNINVGSDTRGYVYKYFEIASYTSNIFNYFKAMKVSFSCSDYLYLLIEFISGQVFKNFRVLLFLSELLVIIPIYKSINLVSKKDSNIILGMFIFYFYFYNLTFNLSRQAIAIAFLTLSLAYRINGQEKNNLKKSILFLTIGIFFHKTALLGIIIHIIYNLFITKKISVKTKQIIEFLIIIVSILFVFNIENILTFLTSTGIFEHAIQYWDLFKYDHLNIKFLTTAWSLFLIFNLKISNKKNLNTSFSSYLLILDLILIQSAMFLNYIDRIALYFEIPAVFLSYSLLSIDNIKNANKSDKIKLYIIIIGFILYWIFWYCVFNNNNTIPYKFF